MRLLRKSVAFAPPYNSDFEAIDHPVTNDIKELQKLKHMMQMWWIRMLHVTNDIKELQKLKLRGLMAKMAYGESQMISKNFRN